MTRAVRRLFTRSRMYRRIVAVMPDGEWSWSEFERRLGRELGGVRVSCMTLEQFESGELSGLAAWSRDRTQAVIAIPSDATFLHRIHIAGHEAWHLLEGHKGCAQSKADERSAERFATRLGANVAARLTRDDREWSSFAAAFGVVGLGA